jgi:hypothetical protein
VIALTACASPASAPGESSAARGATSSSVSGDSAAATASGTIDAGEPSQPVVPPVDASPSEPPDYIVEAHWEETAEGPTLVVTPTEAARAAAGSYEAGREGWEQLVSRFPDPRLDEAAARLRDQYICHQQFATIDEPDKPTWDLELNRPDVGYLETAKALCNP